MSAYACWVVIISLAAASASTTLAQTVTVTKESPIEATLALIDTGSTIVSTQSVARYQRLLDALVLRCTEERTKIGDMAVRATQLVKENGGRKVLVREMLEAAETATTGQRRQDCAPVMAALITIMAKQ